jgi:hypothetical protein
VSELTQIANINNSMLDRCEVVREVAFSKDPESETSLCRETCVPSLQRELSSFELDPLPYIFTVYEV